MTHKTIIFIDWDDTLFPTSHYKTAKLSQKYLNELDAQLFKLLQHNNIYIISNAGGEWLQKSINMLKNTKQLIFNKKIPVISARDTYINVTTTDRWKIHGFKDIVNTQNHKHLNIVSVGDADYEYVALLELHDHLKNNIGRKILLKNIKFKNLPNHMDILAQLNLLNTLMPVVLTNPTYVDIQLFP